MQYPSKNPRMWWIENGDTSAWNENFSQAKFKGSDDEQESNRNWGRK